MQISRSSFINIALPALLMGSLLLISGLAAAQTPGVAQIDDRNFKVAPTAISLTQKRAQLANFIWGAGGLPTSKLPASISTVSSPIAGLSNVQSVRRLVVNMEQGVSSWVYYFIPTTKNGRMTIVHMGHGCLLDDGPGSGQTAFGIQRTVKALLSNGYAVMALNMPRLQAPPNPDCVGGDAHGQLFNLSVTGNPLKFFLEPITVALNYLESQKSVLPYSGYNIVGLSGGGWTATVYPALDVRIRFSVPVAGTVPGWMRIEPYNHDLEQYLASFYQMAGYTDLYALGAYGAGRRQVQILNRQDNCCFGEQAHRGDILQANFDTSVRYYEWKEKQFLAQVGTASAGFQTIIDEAAPSHMISDHAIQSVILPTLNANTSLYTTIHPVAGGNFCVDVPDFGRPPQNGDRLQVYQCHGGNTQLFYLQGDGVVVTARGNLCLDVPNFGRPPQNGDRLQVYQCNGGINQRFDLISDGSYRTRWGGLCLDVPDYGRAVQNGDPLQLFSCATVANQIFSTPADQTIRAQWGGLCLDVPNFGRAPQSGDPLQFSSCHAGVNQRFDRAADGTIRTQWGGLCLDVPDHGRPPRNGDRVQLYPCHGQDNQRFTIASDGTIHSNWASLCFDVPDNGRPPQSGDPLQLFDCHNRPNQLFRLNR